jgi:hypothetical protein
MSQIVSLKGLMRHYSTVSFVLFFVFTSKKCHTLLVSNIKEVALSPTLPQPRDEINVSWQNHVNDQTDLVAICHIVEKFHLLALH